jgi:predicted nucleic acid-binding protein
MILVDTSVWVDHLRGSDAGLVELLGDAQVVCHPFVVGEVACGNLRNRLEILRCLQALPQTTTAEHGEFLSFLESRRLMGRGLSLVDVHLLASCSLEGVGLWTRDKELTRAAEELGIVGRTA